MRSAEKFSIEDLGAGISRWLSSSAPTLNFDVDQHHCELCKVSSGIRCAFELNVFVSTSLKPDFLLKLIKASLDHFAGIPAFHPDIGYVLSQWFPLSDNEEKDKQKTLSLIENLSNQTAVWKELITERYGHQLGRKTASSYPQETRLPMSLSQQIRRF